MRTDRAKGAEPEADVVQDTLLRVWGHRSFRPGQREAIEASLAGKDVLAVLPTGTGKSLCYQLPSAVRQGLTLVVSPLIALMRDQVSSLAARGVPAATIDSSLGRAEIAQCLNDARYGRYRLLYVSPERLRQDHFLEQCPDLGIATVAVDEAHCVSEWGHSFRPSYLFVADALESMGRPPVIALTATATPRVRKDIETLLRLKNPVKVVTGFDRPNIVWTAFNVSDKRSKLRAILQGVSGPGIVYTGTRRAAEDWAGWLTSIDVAATFYHGGLSADQRLRHQDAWMEGRARVMVATNAFGMGIDKPDVRFVVHVGLPSSLEAYYQEAGRAGRDGRKSYAALLYGAGDEDLPARLIEQSFPDSDIVRSVYDTVCSLSGVAVGSMPKEPLKVDIEKICTATRVDRGLINAAVDYLDRCGIWSVVPVAADGRLFVDAESGALRSFMQERVAGPSATVVELILRGEIVPAGASEADLRLGRLTEVTGLSIDQLRAALDYLHGAGFVRWLAYGEDEVVALAEARHRIRLDNVALRRGRRAARRRLRSLLRYVDSRSCRRQYILAYFGEMTGEQCGRCDVCLGRPTTVSTVSVERGPTLDAVVSEIRSGRPRSKWSIDAQEGQRNVDAYVDWLVDRGYIQPSSRLDGTFTLTPEGEKELTGVGPEA